MAAKYDDLPEAVRKEVQTFIDVNMAWLAKVLVVAGVTIARQASRMPASSLRPSPARNS